mgnify:CR=1 FL=1
MLKAIKLVNFYEKNKKILASLNDNEKEEMQTIIKFYSVDYTGNKNCIYK